MIKNLNFFKSFIKALRKEEFINPHLKMMRCTTQNQPGKLYQILKKLNDLKVNIWNIESNFYLNKPELVYFDMSYKTIENQNLNIESL